MSIFKIMIFYKGDIVQKKINAQGNSLDYLYGATLIGIISEVESDSFVLFKRPLLTKIKLWFGLKI